MGDLVTTNSGGLVGLMHGQGGLTIPQPFERDIFVIPAAGVLAFLPKLCGHAAAQLLDKSISKKT